MQTRNQNNTGFFILMGLAILIGAYVFRGGGVGGGSFTSFVGRQLPAIESNGTWINADSPVSWSSLLGKVVWLEFSFIH